MCKIISVFLFITISFLSSIANIIPYKHSYHVSEFGVKPNALYNTDSMIVALERIKQATNNRKTTIIFDDATYDFYPSPNNKKKYFISNHDQTTCKLVGIAIEDSKNITIDGNGADFIFHERMLPLSIVNSEYIVIKNISIDFKKPHIAQIEVLENNTQTKQITYRVAPWVDYEIRDEVFINKGSTWELPMLWGIAFDGVTKRIIYRTSDIGIGKTIEKLSPNTYLSNWDNTKLLKGSIIALRSYDRPAPGIFISHSKNITIENSTIHYAEGMGLLAQLSENITLHKFHVSIKEGSGRYFTTQADATHFSSCKGKIQSTYGFYEAMMDDAINVHGTYLKIIKRIDEHTVIAKYMHSQAYGFTWGYDGDKVQFIQSSTMELVGAENRIKQIRAVDKPTEHGAKVFSITFSKPIPNGINNDDSFGIENLTWTPEVYFAHNVIKNNRARGTLFSTPKKTIIEYNDFDHTSGSAILLAGDCNGWFETGACRDVTIRYNVFTNALTNMFQFTNAVISIYPEIPDLSNQKKYFHGGKKHSIKIIDNVFNTFDNPILYAKSVSGLLFKDNIILTNNDYKPFHDIKSRFLMEHCTDMEIIP